MFLCFPIQITNYFHTFSHLFSFHFGDSDFSNDPMISRLGWGSIIILHPYHCQAVKRFLFFLFVQDVKTLNSMPLFIVYYFIFYVFIRKDRESKILLCIIYIVTIFSAISLHLLLILQPCTAFII